MKKFCKFSFGKSFIIFICLLVSAFAQAQQSAVKHSDEKSFTYYVYVSGITAKSDIELIEPLISKKAGVISFVSGKFPPEYFVLATANPVSISEVAEWFKTTPFKILRLRTDIKEEKVIPDPIN